MKKLTKTQIKILNALIKYQRISMSIREISQKSRVSWAAIKNNLPKLEKRGIVIESKVGKYKKRIGLWRIDPDFLEELKER